MINRFWAEIRCNYIDDEGFWTVDAWISDDDEEEGRVIAYIDDLTGRVVYCNPVARVDEYAQEVIQTKVKEIESDLKKQNNYLLDALMKHIQQRSLRLIKLGGNENEDKRFY